MKEIYERRIEALKSRLGDCDSMLISNLPNIRYLTGFTGSAALLFVTPKRVHLAVDFRYTEQAARETFLEITRREGNLEDVLAPFLDKGRHCAVEADHMSCRIFSSLSTAAQKHNIELDPKPGLVEPIRIVKDEQEINRLRAASELLESLMEKTILEIREGRSELEIAVEFEKMARLATGRPVPFEPIVASGPRSALPHGTASRREIKRGEFVKVDIGLELDGYVADMTRTFALGSADDRMREVHEVVRRANEKSAAEIKPGMTGAQAHSIAAGVLEEAGLGDNFGHGLGHGVGIEVHEGPRLSPLGKEKLQPGMVFTIEPGAYVPDWGGVRIEDTGVLRDDGVEIFNRLDRSLNIL